MSCTDRIRNTWPDSKLVFFFHNPNITVSPKESNGSNLLHPVCLVYAKSVDEAKDIRAKAVAMEVYFKQAKNTEAERRACFDYGMVDFLPKPVSGEAIKAVLQRRVWPKRGAG